MKLSRTVFTSLLFIVMMALGLVLSCQRYQLTTIDIVINPTDQNETDCSVPMSQKDVEVAANSGAARWVSKLQKHAIKIDFTNGNPWKNHGPQFDVTPGGHSDSSGPAGPKAGTYPYRIHIESAGSGYFCSDPNVIVK